MTLLDGNPVGCNCTRDCEWPCFQRVGLTEFPCCKQCAPLPDPEGKDVDERFDPKTLSILHHITGGDFR